MLKAGSRLWNGAIVTADMAAAYNALQTRMDTYRAVSLPVPDYLLNGAHNLINGAR